MSSGGTEPGDPLSPRDRAQDSLDAMERGALRRRSQSRRPPTLQRPSPGTAHLPSRLGPGPTVSEAPALPAPAPAPAQREALEFEFAELGRRLAKLEAEQARDHLALQFLAGNLSRLGPQDPAWRPPLEDLRSRLEAVEAQLAHATIVLARTAPVAHPPGERAERNDSPEDQRDVRARLSTMGSAGIAVVRRPWPSTALLLGAATVLLTITLRLLSG